MPYNELKKGLPDNLLGRVRPTDVQNCMRAMGWERVSNIVGEIAVYHRPGSDFDEVIVPQNPALSDFALRMAEAVVVLSEVEKRPQHEILNDLLMPSADVLRFRVESSEQQKTLFH